MENNKAALLGVAVPEALGGVSNPGFLMRNWDMMKLETLVFEIDEEMP